jgi:hypothetical protein
MRVCKECRVEKDLISFPKNKECAEGHTHECRDCYNIRASKSRAKKGYPYESLTAYARSKKGLIVRKYYAMTRRVLGKAKDSVHLYFGLDILSKDAFYEFALNDPDFNSLYDLWVASGYRKLDTPSIDRIDSSKGYTIGNMRFLTHYQNSINGLKSSIEKQKAGIVVRKKPARRVVSNV